MTYYGAKDLASAFRTVRDNTIQIAQDIPEDKYGFRPTPDSRSIAETLIHIANIPKIAHEMHAVRKLTTLVGFDFMSFVGPLMAMEKQPPSKAEIVKILAEGRDFTAGWLGNLSEEDLGQSVAMPPQSNNPPTKTRFEMLLGLKEHEMHHRAQLMVVERLIGIVPHLTRRREEMMARMQAQQSQQAGAR